MHRFALTSLVALAIFAIAPLYVIFVLRPSGDAVGVAFVFVLLGVALVYMPLAIAARHSRRARRWVEWFAGSEVLDDWGAWHFYLSNMIFGVVLPLDFVARDFGKPLPPWFRTAAAVAVGVVGVALSVNLIYELGHGGRGGLSHSSRS